MGEYAKEVAQQALIDVAKNVISDICIFNTIHNEISDSILNTPIKLL